MNRRNFIIYVAAAGTLLQACNRKPEIGISLTPSPENRKLLTAVPVTVEKANPIVTELPIMTETPSVSPAPIVSSYSETVKRLEQEGSGKVQPYKDALRSAVDQSADFADKPLESLNITTIEAAGERISIAETNIGVFVLNRQNGPDFHSLNQPLVIERQGDNFTFYVKEKANGKMVRHDLLTTGRQGETAGIMLTKQDGTQVFMEGSVTERGAMIGGQEILDSLSMPISNERVSSIFPSHFAIEKTATLQVNGKTLEIKIIFALNKSLVQRSLEPITNIQFHDRNLVNIFAEIYFRDLMTRYNRQNDTNMSYEAYLELVVDGKGQVTIPGVDESKGEDAIVRETLTVNPQDDIVLELTDTGLPVTVIAKKDAYVAKNKEGRLVLAVNGPTYPEVVMQKENLHGARGAESIMIMIYFTSALESICLSDQTLLDKKEDQNAYMNMTGNELLLNYVNSLPGYDVKMAMWDTQ